MTARRIAIGLAIVLVVLVVWIPSGPAWLLPVTGPVRQSVSGTVAAVTHFWSWFGDINKLSAERDGLAAERNRLQARVAELEGVERQNEALRQQLHVVGSLQGYQPVLAGVTGVTNQGGANYVVLDKGTADGIEIGQAVLTEGVLVGRVRRVSAHAALVQMPQSLDSVIPVAIHYEGGTTKGVVEGSYNLTAQLTQVLHSEKLEEGATMVTSGEGGTYPANLVVGVVGSVSDVPNQLFQSATVVFGWDLTKLESVLVLKAATR